MTPASLWLKTFFAGFLVVGAMLVMTLFTPVPYGDLTRIGRLSDAEFGWRAPPPPAPPTDALHSVPLDQADIVVIGDSFSMTLYWQAPLVQAGYRVSTIYWGQFGYLCRDFPEWLRRSGFKGHTVIVESVERLLSERLHKGDACQHMLKAPDVRSTPFIRSLTRVPDFGLNWTAKLTTGPITYRNMQRVKRSTTDQQFGDETQVRFVPDGCAQFSHRMCARALFFKEDMDNGPLTTEDFNLLDRFTQAQPFKLLWMVIPNKTTVYLDPSSSKPFMDAFRRAGYGPDLFTLAQEERRRVRDFYFPNDTHLSMHGQMLLGDLMLQEVRKLTPPAAR